MVYAVRNGLYECNTDGWFNSNGDASLLISASRLGPFDKNCELVLDGNPDTLKPLSTADLDHFYRAIAQNKDGIAVLYEAVGIVRWMRMHFTEPFT